MNSVANMTRLPALLIGHENIQDMPFRRAWQDLDAAYADEPVTFFNEAHQRRSLAMC